MRTLSVFCSCTLLLLVGSCIALPEDEPYIDLTWHFSFSATSVCGDPPTQFEYPKNSGQLESCNGSDYSEEKALDRNSSTRWQSANGETPVEISFTLKKVCHRKRRGWSPAVQNPSFIPVASGLAKFGRYSNNDRRRPATLPLPGGEIRTVIHNTWSVRARRL